MNIHLAEQLRKLRKEKGNTQEELAVHLGITTQAVSKWEREEGYPDISLLPVIALYYDVSIDDLLGVGEMVKEKRRREISEQNITLFRTGKNRERVALLREAKKEFPNDLSILYDLMYALQAEKRKEANVKGFLSGAIFRKEVTQNGLYTQLRNLQRQLLFTHQGELIG